MAGEIKLPKGLHKESVTFLKESKPVLEALFSASTFAEKRKKYEGFFAIGTKVVEYDGTRVEMFVPYPDVPGGTPIYVYKPKSLTTNPAVLIYFHAGGLVLGKCQEIDTTCKSLASKIGCIVVNVEYRLAPEHKFPVMFDESCAVVKWVLGNKTLVGAKENSKVGVAGDSAGGLLSASVANDVPGLAFQILIYPWLSAGLEPRLSSFEEFKDGLLLSEPFLQWLESEIAAKEDLTNPRLVPLRQTKLDHSPPTLFIVTEFDMLRDDSYEYSKKLTAAGVHSELALSKGAVHLFYVIPEHFVELCGEAYEKTADFIRRFGN